MSSPVLSVKAFAPVNIAWIKYMGKVEGHPANSSLSLTLNSFGTTTELSVAAYASRLHFKWDEKGYVPPPGGILKMEAFLRNEAYWKNLLGKFGFQLHLPDTEVLIHTFNNIPAGTGIASSASSYAAMTLAWSALLAGPRFREWIDRFHSDDFEFKKAVAAIAAKGSGSACRSLDGPWIEWSPESGIQKVNGGKTSWVDFILVVESAHKSVPSSEAHSRVKSSPLYADRPERAQKRLDVLKPLLLKDSSSIPEIRRLVLEEALDMHELFHTSVPPFGYMNQTSHEIVSCFQSDAVELPSKNAVLTLDAGANVHVFVPSEEQKIWSEWLSENFNQVKILQDQSSTRHGARYEGV